METLTLKRIPVLVGTLVLLSLPAFLAPFVGREMSALARVVSTGNPYLSGIDPSLLYAVMPLSVTAALVLVMSPGLLGVLALGRGRNLWGWLLEGFVLSLGAISLVAATVQGMIGRPLTGAVFVSVVLLLTFAAGMLLHLRAARGHPISWPLATRRSRLVMASLIAVPLLFLLALTPKFFWESFNGDGAHAFETTRQLLHGPLPFWPPGAGAVRGWPGVNGLVVTYPSSWFMRLFGEFESAVRLPLLLYLPLLFSGVAAVAEHGREKLLRPAPLALIWSGVVSFALVMSYSATYDPYSADIAMPATQDFLVMIFFLGAVTAFVAREGSWLVVWTLLALMTSPASLPLLGLFLVAWLLSSRPPPWRRVVSHGVGLTACLLVLALVPLALGLFGVVVQGSEHNPAALFLRQFEYMAVADFERFAWVALPAGIYPVIGLFRWGRSDALTRALIVLTVALFAMYYVMGTLSLHYFVPVMLLPLAIFWRKYEPDRWGGLPIMACWVGAGISLWLALPAGTGIYSASRIVGEQIDSAAFSGYAEMDLAAFRAGERLSALFQTDGRPDVPEKAYGGSPLAWMYYASRESAPASPKNYALLPPHTPRPEGAVEILRDSVAAVYVYDTRQWEEHRTLQPRHSRGKEIYRVPRTVLFDRGPASRRPGFFKPRTLLARLLRRDQ